MQVTPPNGSHDYTTRSRSIALNRSRKVDLTMSAYAPIITARTADASPDGIAMTVWHTTDAITRLADTAAATDTTDHAALDTLYADAAAHASDLYTLMADLADRNALLLTGTED